MAFAGKQLQPRDIAGYVAGHWDSLIKATATAISESHGYLGAFHDNTDSQGNVTSRDCGLFQINIPASHIGSEEEARLRTESTDPNVYAPVAEYNTFRARELYDQPWTRDGKPDIRRYQPWVAYTTGWTTFPEWWIWDHQIGPWVPTGRYIQNALVGVANYHLLIKKDMDIFEALDRARSIADQFKVTKGILGVKKSKTYPDGYVAWIATPEKPASPPDPPPGPRPVPNDGR